MTTIISRGFFEKIALAAEEECVCFLDLQTGQMNMGPSFVRLKTILFSHVGQNSITISSLDRVIGVATIQY